MRHVSGRGTPKEESIVSVCAAFYTSPNTEVPESIVGITSADIAGRTVAAVRDVLWRLAKAADYPLLNSAGFEPNAKEGKFVFVCDRCDMVFTGEAPILKCPVDHEEGGGGSPL